MAVADNASAAEASEEVEVAQVSKDEEEEEFPLHRQHQMKQGPHVLIPATYAEKYKEDSNGEYELVTVHVVPIHESQKQPASGGKGQSEIAADEIMEDETDPWSHMAAELGIDLNDYNVTYPEGTSETLEKDHRRLRVSVNAWENNNARFVQFERRKRGLQQVSWGADLIQQAQMQARYMVRACLVLFSLRIRLTPTTPFCWRLTHTDNCKRSCFLTPQASVQHIAHRSNLAQGVSLPWQVITENVSQNVNVGFSGAHKTLMNSPGHRANILNVRVNRVGMGVVKRGA